jgi:hypothetical protein
MSVTQNVLPIIRTSRVRIASFSLIPTANLLIASLECDTGTYNHVYFNPRSFVDTSTWDAMYAGMMKEYRVPFTEEQNFSSRVPRDMPHVKFTSDSGSLSKVLSTFHSGVDVIAIKCDSSQSVHDAVIEFRTYMMQDGG